MGEGKGQGDCPTTTTWWGDIKIVFHMAKLWQRQSLHASGLDCPHDTWTWKKSIWQPLFNNFQFIFMDLGEKWHIFQHFIFVNRKLHIHIFLFFVTIIMNILKQMSHIIILLISSKGWKFQHRCFGFFKFHVPVCKNDKCCTFSYWYFILELDYCLFQEYSVTEWISKMTSHYTLW